MYPYDPYYYQQQDAGFGQEQVPEYQQPAEEVVGWDEYWPPVPATVPEVVDVVAPASPLRASYKSPSAEEGTDQSYGQDQVPICSPEKKEAVLNSDGKSPAPAITPLSEIMQVDKAKSPGPRERSKAVAAIQMPSPAAPKDAPVESRAAQAKIRASRAENTPNATTKMGLSDFLKVVKSKASHDHDVEIASSTLPEVGKELHSKGKTHTDQASIPSLVATKDLPTIKSVASGTKSATDHPKESHRKRPPFSINVPPPKHGKAKQSKAVTPHGKSDDSRRAEQKTKQKKTATDTKKHPTGHPKKGGPAASTKGGLHNKKSKKSAAKNAKP